MAGDAARLRASHGGRRRAPGTLLAGVLLGGLLAACGSTGPTPSSGPAGDAVPVPDGADAHSVVLTNADGKWNRYRSIGRLSGASDCTVTVVDGGVATPGADQPAYAVTNGHCIDLLQPNQVDVDAKPPWPVQVTLDWFADTAASSRHPISVPSIAWGTMKGTDLAVIRLDTTLGALASAGYQPFRLASALPASPTRVVNVGAPSMGVGSDTPYLRAGACTVDSTPRLIREHEWTWTGALRADCPDIYGGSSGSPVIDRATGQILALVNTTTAGSTPGGDCLIHRPCEVAGGTWSVQEKTAYVMPVAGLAACFDGSGTFALGGACGLDAGTGPELSGTPMMANPAAPAFAGRAAVTTWQTKVSGDGVASYRTLTGRMGAVDCADETKYGPSVALAASPVISTPLPAEPGLHELCVLGYASDGTRLGNPAHASLAAVIIDTTPPPQAQVDFIPDETGGWVVQPHFGAPDWAEVWFAAGKPAAVDCSDQSSYRILFTVAPRFEPADLPARMCVQALDMAGNKAPLLVVDVPPTP